MSERERWRNVRRAAGYRVSSYGRVRSVDRTLSDGRAAGGVPLTQFRDDDGYWCVKIAGETVRVHVVVLEAFRGPRPYGQEGCHGPDGKDDNRASVLRWDTHRENERDKKRAESRIGTGATRPDLVGTVGTGDQQC